MWRKIYQEVRRWAKVSDRAVAAYKRTEITLETNRIWIIRKRNSTRVWCPGCRREVDVVRLSDAAELSGASQPIVTRPLLANRVGAAGARRGWIGADMARSPAEVDVNWNHRETNDANRAPLWQ
jgi:hypothetical protein